MGEHKQKVGPNSFYKGIAVKEATALFLAAGHTKPVARQKAKVWIKRQIALEKNK